MTPPAILSVSRARRLRALFAALVSVLSLGAPFLAVVLSVAACRPKLPPVSGCTPLSHRCEADSPEVCSPSQRWHRVGDVTCAAVGARCLVLDAGVAACAPYPDAGAQVELELSVTSPSTDGGAE